MKKRYWGLFLSFLKVGAFTFGGGYAMLPLIERETVDTHHWLTNQELLDIFAVSQVTPGAIAVNAATYVGYKVARFWGAVFATLGVVLPSFVIISLISMILTQFMQFVWVQYAFYGIRVGVILLMVQSVIKLIRTDDQKSAFYFVLFGAGFAIAAFTQMNIIFLLILAIAAGIVVAICKKKAGKGAK